MLCYQFSGVKLSMGSFVLFPHSVHFIRDNSNITVLVASFLKHEDAIVSYDHNVT